MLTKKVEEVQLSTDLVEYRDYTFKAELVSKKELDQTRSIVDNKDLVRVHMYDKDENEKIEHEYRCSNFLTDLKLHYVLDYVKYPKTKKELEDILKEKQDL